jgi:diguanylate cyclase (GGDEF)-like protein/PAS domain S-box-containing protein
MAYQFSNTSIGFVSSALLCLIIAWIVWFRRDNPGSKSFILMMCTFSIWSIAANFELIANDFKVEYAWMIVENTAQDAVGPLLLAFVMQFTRPENKLKKSLYWMLWIIPLISFVIVVTNQYHGLAFSNIQSKQIDTATIVVFESGLVIYITMIYDYFLIFLGLYRLIRYFFTLGKKGILTAIMIAIASLISMVINLLFVLSPQTRINITPHTFSLLSIVLYWAISQEQLFTIKPIAYRTLMESLPDSILVLNNDNRIIKANPAALALLNVTQADIFGKSLKEAAPYLCRYGPECFSQKTEVVDEIKLPGDGNRIIRLRMQSIIKSKKKIVGKIISLQDITALKNAEDELNKKYQFTETLVNATSEINTTLEIDDVLEKVLENAAEVVPYDAADIVLVDKDDKYRFACVKCFDKSHPNDFLLGLNPMKENLYGFEKMVENNEAIIISDTNIDPNWNPSLEGTNWIRSYLGAPIQYRGKNIGFINLGKKEPNGFKPENAKQIQVFANYAASAISNANMFNEIRQNAHELLILNEISQVLNAGLGLEETIISTFEQLKLILPIDSFGFTLYNSQTQNVESYIYRADGNLGNIPSFNLFKEASVSQYFFKEKGIMYIPDIYADDSRINTDEIAWIEEFKTRSLLGTALLSREEVFGVLLVGSLSINAFTQEHIRLFEIVALQSSSAIDNARLFERVERLSITDELTGLENRRHFNLMLEKEIERARRYDHPLCMIMLDIDHFKEVNDKYGHTAGDTVLRKLADVVEECLRKPDLAFRFGGEEFMILLPETKMASAKKAAERIRTNVENIDFSLDHDNLQITISLGVCEYQDSFVNMTEFINAVDHALYQAKSSGRNRVCIYKGK